MSKTIEELNPLTSKFKRILEELQNNAIATGYHSGGDSKIDKKDLDQATLAIKQLLIEQVEGKRNPFAQDFVYEDKIYTRIPFHSANAIHNKAIEDVIKIIGEL